MGETYGGDKQDRQLVRRALTGARARGSTQRPPLKWPDAALEAAPGCTNVAFLGCPARATGLGCGVHSPERLGAAGPPLWDFSPRCRSYHRSVGRAARFARAVPRLWSGLRGGT